MLLEGIVAAILIAMLTASLPAALAKIEETTERVRQRQLAILELTNRHERLLAGGSAITPLRPEIASRLRNADLTATTVAVENRWQRVDLTLRWGQPPRSVTISGLLPSERTVDLTDAAAGDDE